MLAPEVRRATAAALSTAAALGLTADEATVLNNSNKLTLRLLPCDVVARVAPAAEQVAQFEVDLARHLVASGCPVAAPDPRVEPRVHERDGFVITLWTYHPPVTPHEVPPADFAAALERLHTGMRTLGVPAPHFTERVARAQELLADRDRTPELADPDRELLAETLRTAGRLIAERGGTEQLLHGEPHPGNLLNTRRGPLFVDLATCCRGPVEFDLAHAPEEVAQHYAGADQGLIDRCRALNWAMFSAWRWRQDDQMPDRAHWRVAGLNRVRETLDRCGPG